MTKNKKKREEAEKEIINKYFGGRSASNNQRQDEFNKKADSFFGITFVLVLVFLAILGFGSMFADIFGWAGKKLDSRDSKKQECLERTYNVKNEFTAKKMYKKCMSE